MANQTITQLPTAQALTGTELVPIVQDGGTVKTTVADIAATPVTNYSFVTATSEGSLSQSRQLSTSGSGLTLTDNGAGSTLNLSLSGAAASLVSAGTGIQVKTSATTLTARSIAVGTAGLSVTDGDGVAADPTISLTGMPLYLAQSTGVGLLTRTSGNSVGIVTIQGTANEIDVSNGTGNAGDPTVGLADNPTIPGTAGILVPVGTTGQRSGSPSNGVIRYNSTTQAFEGYANSAWRDFAQTGGVTSFSAGTTGLTPTVATTGNVTLAGTLNVASGGTGATALTGYVKGNGTSAFTALATIPNTDISGLGTMSTQNAGSVAITGGTINSTTIGATTAAAGTFTTLTANGNTVITSSGATDALRITQTGSGNALLVEDSANPDSSPFVVDASGRLLVGATTSYAGLFSNAGNVQISSTSLHGLQNARFANDTFGSDIQLLKSRSATIGAQTIVQSGDVVGNLLFGGSDGTAFIPLAIISAQVDGTPGTNDMPGRLVFQTTADGASSPTERMRIDSSGAVGIGAAVFAGVQNRFAQNITGATNAYPILADGTVQSDVTSGVGVFRSAVNTAAAAFTLTNLRHFWADQGTIGAGSAVTSQYGFSARATLTGATNNYGFYSDIASGTGRWNFYANGTAANYFAGDMQLDKTVTATGTTGAQTINKNAGTVNFAAAATSLVVTDSRVTANSIIICTVGTNDTTMKSVAAVAGAGSFTLHANAAATAETRVNFLIIN